MRRIFITGIAALLATITAYGQGVRDVVINEILVRNIDNYMDDYGHRVAWIELHNAGHAKADLASCYLSMRIGDESIMYRIPKNDPRTVIAPQGYTVFFCEGTATKGTFHTSFKFDLEGGERVPLVSPAGDTVWQINAPNQEVTLALFEANGKDTIDKVNFNLADQLDDVSIGRTLNERGEIVFVALGSTTPYATNVTTDAIPAHELFRRVDPIGYVMSVTAMMVVMIALFLLYMIFRALGKTMQRQARKKLEVKTEPALTVKAAKGEVFSGEDMAAIALALYLYQSELHDKESVVLTINRVAKTYSPWSSKLYGLTRTPDRR